MWEASARPADSALLAKARAMTQAVAFDFAALPGVEVWTTRDVRVPEFHPAKCHVVCIASAAEESATLKRLAKDVDWTLLIAPESGGGALRRCQRVEAVGGRLLSPSSAVVEIAADKHRTIELLAKCGVPIVRGMLLQNNAAKLARFSFPAVLKPIDGCGSAGVRLIRDVSELPQTGEQAYRLEEFVPGLAASVAVLCGPTERLALPACEQRLSGDGTFKYLGGRVGLPKKLDDAPGGWASRRPVRCPSRGAMSALIWCLAKQPMAAAIA